MYTLSHDPSSDTQPSSEVTIETKRHRPAEVDTVTSARRDADLPTRPLGRRTRHPRALERVATVGIRVTGTPGNCVTKYSSSTFRRRFFRARRPTFRHEHDRCVQTDQTNIHAPVRARACTRRAAATSRGKTRGNRREIGTENRVSGGRDGVHSILQLLYKLSSKFFVYTSISGIFRLKPSFFE